MRRVLIQQHQSAIRFQQHIQPAYHADEPQRNVQQRRGRLRGPYRRRSGHRICPRLHPQRRNGRERRSRRGGRREGRFHPGGRRRREPHLQRCLGGCRPHRGGRGGCQGRRKMRQHRCFRCRGQFHLLNGLGAADRTAGFVMKRQQRVVDRPGHEFAHFKFPVKLHLPLRRMDIHVHCRRVNFDKQAANRVAPLHQGVMVALNQRVIDAPILHGTPIYKHKLAIPGRPRHPRRANQTPHL